MPKIVLTGGGTAGMSLLILRFCLICGKKAMKFII